MTLPLFFASENGGIFRPHGLVIQSRTGTLAVAVPNRGFEAQSEDHIELRDVPLLGGLFRKRLDPSDARKGDLLGPVSRVGNDLYINASGWPGSLSNLPVTVTTWTPRYGTISYRLGRQAYAPVSRSNIAGPEIGAAYLLDGQLVIASNGADVPSINDLVRGNF